MSRGVRPLLAGLLLALAGCAHWVVNDPLVAGRPAPPNPLERATAGGKNTNNLFECLAIDAMFRIGVP